MVKNITFLLVFKILISAVFAQEYGKILGTVIDRQTKEPLVGVNISIIGSEKGSSTNGTGNFEIENIAVGTYILEFNYLGYAQIYVADIVVKRSRPAILNVEMTETPLVGEEITVTAGYFIEETMIQPSTIGLSREEIRRFPGGFEDVVRTVSTLPGVSINTGGGRNDLLVRGGGPSENLYVINNIEVPNINHFGTQGTGSGSLSFINLDFVDKVSFSTGGFSARYGDKMSSLLTLELADGRKDRLGGKLLLSATQYGLNFEGPFLNKGNFIFSARQSYLDLIFKAAGLPFIPVYTDFNFSVHLDASPRDKIFLIGLAAINRVDRDQGSVENRVRNAGLMDNTQNQYIAGANYRRILDKGYLDFILTSNFYQYRFSQVDEFENEYFNSKANEQEVGIKSNIYHSFSKYFGAYAGISWKTVSNENQTVFADTIYNRSGNRVPVSEIGAQPFLETTANARKIGTFFEIEYYFTPKISINAGLRADYFSFLAEPFYLSPRLSVKFQMTDHHSFKANGGIYHQSPSYVWTVNTANKGLQALENQMIILGWDYLFRNDFRLSLETFYKKYENLPTGIIPDVTDYIIQTNTGTGFGGREDDFQSFGYYDLVSEGYGNAYGIEFLLQKKFSEIPCYGQFSFSYGKSEYTAANGLTYPGQFDQRVILNLSGGYIFDKNWEFSTKFRYFTGIPYTPVYRPQSNPINAGSIQNLPQEYLSSRLKDAHHLDVRLDRYFYLSNWTLIIFIDIQNIYNYKIPQPPRYDFWDDEIVNQDEIGILPSIGISAEF